MDEDELYAAAKNHRQPVQAGAKLWPRTGACRSSDVHRRRHRDPGRRRAHDAARRRRRVRGLGHLQELCDPAADGRCDRQGDDALRRPADRWPRSRSASAMRWAGKEIAELGEQGLLQSAWLVGSGSPRASGRLPRALPRASRRRAGRGRGAGPGRPRGPRRPRDPRRRVDDHVEAHAGLRPRGADLDFAAAAGPSWDMRRDDRPRRRGRRRRPDQRSLGLIDLDVRRTPTGARCRASRPRSGSRARTCPCTASSSAPRGSSGWGGRGGRRDARRAPVAARQGSVMVASFHPE